MRLAIFVTHPIQYFAPLWRGLAASGMDLKVFFFSDHSVSGRLDSGFGVNVKWDVPVLEGYQSEFISRGADLERPSSVAIPDPDGLLDKEKPEVVMIHGYRNRFEQQLTKICRKRGIPTVLRGEFSDAPTYHGRSRLKGLLRSIFLKRYYRRITSFCFIGQIARQHLLSYGVAEKQLFFSPYSVDTDLFEKQIALLDRSRCREELKIKQDETVLLFSGKLIPRKAPLLILDALNRLSDETLPV